MQDNTSLFKIIDFQRQIFKAILSFLDIYPINYVTNPLVLATNAKKPIKNFYKIPIINIRIIYELIKVWYN